MDVARTLTLLWREADPPRTSGPGPLWIVGAWLALSAIVLGCAVSIAWLARRRN